jgi:hypothetical protein
MSTFRPILPGSAEYNKALKDVRSLTGKASGMEVVFTENSFGKSGGTIKHAVIATDEKHSKIVILLTRVSVPVMQVVSTKLRELTTALNLPGTSAEAEPSPVINKQFDYVLFNVPSIRAEDIRNYLVNTLIKLND